jgi:hypothetical protein
VLALAVGGLQHATIDGLCRMGAARRHRACEWMAGIGQAIGVVGAEARGRRVFGSLRSRQAEGGEVSVLILAPF